MPHAGQPFDPQRRQDDQLPVADTSADPSLDTLVRLIREVFGVGIVLLSPLEREGQWCKARDDLQLPQPPRRIAFCEHSIVQGEFLQIEDARRDPRFQNDPLVTGAPCVRFYAGHPLFDEEGHPLGSLCLFDPQPRTLNPREIGLLQDFASLAESALKLNAMTRQTAELREALTREQRKTMLDPLTQVWNRAGLEHLLPRELAAVEREGLHLGMLFCDLDYFKTVNDRYGHACGDQALWEAARRIRASVRPQDLVVRAGGEEFVVLARVPTTDELLLIAERIRSSMAATPILTEQARLQLTLSIGTTLLQPGESAADALARADQALYRAKGSGRNLVVQAGSD